MAGAVSSPFTASMFRFDGVSITNSNFIVNTNGDNKLCKVINLLVFMAIYFLKRPDRSSDWEGGADFGNKKSRRSGIKMTKLLYRAIHPSLSNR